MYRVQVLVQGAVTMDFVKIFDDRLIKNLSLGDHLMAVIIVYGGNFGRNSHYPVEFPVSLRRTVTLSEFGSV